MRIISNQLLRITIPSLFLALASTPSLAENSVVIDQIGAGSIEVQQSGQENSTEIHQNSKDPSPQSSGASSAATAGSSPSPLGTPSPINGSDYQKAILNNPYTSPYARAKVLSSEDNPSPVADPKKAVADAKKALADEKKATNKISIHQKGEKNSASTSQKGVKNDLAIEQEGSENNVNRDQSGDENHSRIIQNGNVIEDK